MSTQEQTSRVSWRPVLVFVALAMGVSWVISLVFWFGGWDSLYGLSPNHLVMLTPSLATLIVVLFVRRPRSILRATALWPLRPVGRIAGYCLVALMVPVLLGTLTPLLAAGLGLFDLDVQNFSMLRQHLDKTLPGFTGEGTGFPASAYLAWLGTLAMGFLIILPFAFGEEWGWRGYLLPKLLPLGVWPALLLSGLIHGLWHAPLGMFMDRSVFGGAAGFATWFTMYVAVVVGQGVMIGWLRLSSGSVWPAVIVHASQLSFMIIGAKTLGESGTESGPLVYPGGMGGVVGLAVVVAFAVFLGVTRQIRVRPDDPALPDPPPVDATDRRRPVD